MQFLVVCSFVANAKHVWMPFRNLTSNGLSICGLQIGCRESLPMKISLFPRRSWPVAGFMALSLTFGGCNSSSQDSGTSGGIATSQQAAEVSDEQLKAMLDDVIEHTKNRHLSPQVNNAWQIVHALLAYGNDLQLDDQKSGKLVPALKWMLAGGEVRGWGFRPRDRGIEALMEEPGKVGPGHDDQWLGYLSQQHIPLDEPVMVQGTKYKVSDLLSQTKWNVREGMEATWTLMAAGEYLKPDEKWLARDGGEWSIERLIAMESDQKLSESACGGSHRMYAIASALQKYVAGGGQLTGGWLKADERVKDTIKRARDFQQPDGGYSTQFFERSATSSEITLRINTTGHVFEFLALALDDKQLREPSMRRSAIYLCKMLQATKEMPLECGGLYHAAHGLVLYRQRMFGDQPSSSAAPMSDPKVATTTNVNNDAPPPPEDK